VERFADLEMLQQKTRRARIFRQNGIHRLQHIHRPQRNVIQVTDGGGDEVEFHFFELRVKR
jgi:hypothetical protein